MTAEGGGLSGRSQPYQAALLALLVSSASGCTSFDGVDNPDANISVDGCVAQTLYADTDGDGFGDPAAPVQTCEASLPGTVANADDCDDTSDAIKPGALEICDGNDTDCNGTMDDGFCAAGCADGEREGFVDGSTYTDIAGCSGAWETPGLLGVMARGCAAPYGDDSTTPPTGCSAIDLCTVGWHVCATTAEGDAATAGNGCADATAAGDPNLFFAVGLSGPGGGACGAGANDVFGCGNVGAGTASCGLYNRFSQDLCGSLPTPPWQCGGNGLQEATAVVKPTPDVGGVLCCRDP